MAIWHPTSMAPLCTCGAKHARSQRVMEHFPWYMTKKLDVRRLCNIINDTGKNNCPKPAMLQSSWYIQRRWMSEGHVTLYMIQAKQLPWTGHATELMIHPRKMDVRGPCNNIQDTGKTIALKPAMLQNSWYIQGSWMSEGCVTLLMIQGNQLP